MRFHVPSFVLGFTSGLVLRASAERLRPVAVELGALGLHLGRLARGIVDRQREHGEDLWAEIEERARARLRGRHNGAARPVMSS